MEFNYVLGNKKCLYYNLKSYYSSLGKNIGDLVPVTFHIDSMNEEYEAFKNEFLLFQENQKEENVISESNKEQIDDTRNKADPLQINEISNNIKSKNIWIVKPGENSNRGNGINLCDSLKDIEKILTSKSTASHTYIIQKYIERPLLYNQRKFDIRCFAFFTSVYGNLKG